VNFRWAVNTRARQALTAWADNSHQALRRRPPAGRAPPHAIGILMRAWVRVLWACWHNGTAYDPLSHGAEKRLAELRPRRQGPRRSFGWAWMEGAVA
jgi:hypothetical protein